MNKEFLQTIVRSAMKMFCIIFVLAFVLCHGIAFAQSSSIINGLAYLHAVQSPAGYWGDVSEVPYNSFVDSCAVTETLKYLTETGTAYNSAIQWINSTEVSNNDYLFTKMLVLAQAGFNVSAIRDYLLSIKNDDGGWGVEDDFESDIKRTTLALQALKAVNYSDQTVIQSALGYLLSTQNTDGGWGFYQGDESNVYMTALVSITLQQFPRTTSNATAINKTTSYLIAHQNADGGFSSTSSGQGSGSTVYETALAYISLVGVTTDNTVLGNAVNYLTSTQSPDGSWLQDPYSTALALRALYLSENKPEPPPPPTTGTVTGKLVDASTNQPLGGVSVVLQADPSMNTVTDATGNFTLSNIPPGSQKVNFSLSGYATATATVNITAGSIVNLGTIPLSTNPTTGIIKGTVTDAANGQSLSDVTITVTGSFNGNTVTGIDGSFIFTDVTPGSVTITASKTEYYSVTGTGTVVAGGILFFNPQLSTSPPTATTGNLAGKVYDGSTNIPIQGAAISLSGATSTTTDAQGSFLIKDITPGTYQVTISASGYISQTYQVMIIAGVTTDMQTVYLTPSLQSTTVTGKVTDASTGNPIAGADVAVVGTAFSSKTATDGTYSITGITELEFSLKASAVGYDSLIHIISLIDHGIYTVDFPLAPSQTGDLKIVSLSTDKQSYTAYSPVSIMAEVRNSGSAPVGGTVIVSMLNEQGQVVDNIQATWTDADSTVQSHFDFQPGAITSISIPWETGDILPGAYSIIAKVMKGEVVAGGGAVVVAERVTGFLVDPTQAIVRLTLTPLPRFTNLGAAEQISIQADLVNRSNVATELGIAYEWRSPGGLLIKSGTGIISLLPAETTKSVTLETFPYTFAESGEHPITIQILSGPIPVSLIGDVVSVAPGIRIEPGQTITPSTVVPDGDKRIRIDIRLKGVEQK